MMKVVRILLCLPAITLIGWLFWASSLQVWAVLNHKPPESPQRASASQRDSGTPPAEAVGYTEEEAEILGLLIRYSIATYRACEGAFDDNAEAQLHLALGYAMYGMGLTVNRTRAYAWALIAEENDAYDASSIRSLIAGKLQEADFQQAWDWKRAIELRIADPAMVAKKKCSMELVEYGIETP